MRIIVHDPGYFRILLGEERQYEEIPDERIWDVEIDYDTYFTQSDEGPFGTVSVKGEGIITGIIL